MKILNAILRATLIAIAIEGSFVWSAEDPHPLLETTVKVLRPVASPQPAMPMRMAARPALTPTTPSAKYPQYQLGHPLPHRSQDSVPADPHLRFFLKLPNQTLLVEAIITIDGLPFSAVRQQRIARIVRELKVGKDIPLPDPSKEPQRSEAPEVAAQFVSNLDDRFRHTIQVTGVAPSAEEVDWIISNWIDGPTVLQLNDNFQRFRASQRPELFILDRDHDGIVSSDELRLAATYFQECDLNQDGLIQFTEIAVAAMASRARASLVDSGSLITLVPDQASASIAHARLGTPGPARIGQSAPIVVARFDANGNGQFELEELQAMRSAAPDLKLSISFDTSNPDASRIALMQVSPEIAHPTAPAKIDSTGIQWKVGETPIIFSAIQGPPSEQVSIGAVDDGYPVLPALDPDDDGRLTIRELRGLSKTLTAFDANHDGALTIEETQSPIRVCFGLGATVHRELAGIRSIHRKSTTPVVAPEWFTRMDRNKDNDLTRGEFPGTDEQFRALDADGDELVSASEAIEFDRKLEPPSKADNRPLSDQTGSKGADSTSTIETKP